MQASASNFKTIIEGTKQYLVPLFQRTYCWEKKDVENLWADILELYQAEPGVNREHFIGSFVTMPDSATAEGVTRFILIDGQQRMTTLLLFLAAIRDEARLRGMDTLAGEIHDLYLTNRYQEGENSYKLLPPQADRLQFYAAIESDGHGLPASAWLRQACQLAKRYVAGTDESGEPFDLRRLKEIVSLSLALVSITLSADDNPYVIFQSLNGTGAALTQADLIRNYFFMRLPYERQQAVYDSVWLPMQEALTEQNQLNHFFRHYLSKDGSMANLNTLYNDLRGRADRECKSAAEVEEYLHRIARYAGYYRRVLEPSLESDAAVRERLARSNRWGVTVSYPLVLNLYDDYCGGRVSALEFATMLGDIESFVVRRFFCGIPTNRLNKIFVAAYRAAGLAESASGAGRVERLRQYLKGQGWPDDETFCASMLRYPIYGETHRCKMILELLEAAEGHKEAVHAEELQIEHVMPQALTAEWQTMLGPESERVHERWLHTLGNLTLTGYNPELSNGTFSAKLAIYTESHISLNRHFAALSLWTEDEIMGRGQCLAAHAAGIWARP